MSLVLAYSIVAFQCLSVWKWIFAYSVIFQFNGYFASLMTEGSGEVSTAASEGLFNFSLWTA
jgi:hypothetical protein